MSARTLSSGYNYDSGIKSLLISSDYQKSAYVLSNFNTISTSDSQILYKFDPLTFSSAPIWSKQTIASSSNNWGHLGLTFGRNEKFIYSFSLYNLKSTVTLLDINGNS